MRNKTFAAMFAVLALAAIPAAAGAATATYQANSGFGMDTGIDVAIGDVMVATASSDFNICGGHDGGSGYCYTGSVDAWVDFNDRWQFGIADPYDGGAWYKVGDGSWTRFSSTNDDTKTTASVTATSAGRLYITTNDRYYGWGDNVGGFSVDVSRPTPVSSDQCKKGGWQTYGVFKNQGDCVSYVATGGTNKPAGS